MNVTSETIVRTEYSEDGITLVVSTEDDGSFVAKDLRGPGRASYFAGFSYREAEIFYRLLSKALSEHSGQKDK